MSNNDAPPVLAVDIAAAKARQAATDSQAASTIDSAVSRSSARTTSNMAQARSSLAGSARGAVGSLVVTFSDIEAMTSAIRVNTAHVEQILAQVVPMATRSDLVESIILSPFTGAEAEGAVVAAAGRLTLHIAMSEALGIVSVTIVSTYQLVDAALSMGAASLNFVGSAFTTGAQDVVDVSGAFAKSAGNEVVTHIENEVQVLGGFAQEVLAEVGVLETGVLLVGFGISSVAAGFLEEGFSAWFESFGPTFNQFVKDPWLLLAAPITIPALITANTVNEFSQTAAWGDSYNTLQTFLGAMGPAYDGIVSGVLWDFKTFGWTDGGKLVPNSVVSASELQSRRDAFAQAARLEKVTVSADKFAPTSVEQLLVSGGQLDAMGANDEAVIRVVESGNPPTFTVIIPSTQYWLPWASNDPNDLIGNLNVMLGHSQLEDATKSALQKAMTQYSDTHGGVSVANAPVMLAGFSQGGITAAAFAQDYSGQFNIQQLVTAGAPIGRFDIPSSVNVLAYESTADPVPRLDGTENPTGSNWQTVHADDTGTGAAGSHNDVLYAKMAAGNPPDAAQQASLNQFLGGDGTVTDYYATK